MAESAASPAPKAGADTGASGAPGSEEAPKALSAEDVHSAITSRFKDFERSFTKKLEGTLTQREEGLLGKFGASLDEKLAALKPKEEPAKKQEAPAFKLEDLPEWKQQQAELERLKKESEDNKRAAAEEKAKGRATALRTGAVEALVKAGVPADRAPHALAYLQSLSRINYADGGKGEPLVFVADDAEQPLDEGLKSWVKGQDAKIYLPPQNPQGSGGGPGAPGNGAAGPYADLNEVLRRHVMGQQ